MSTIIRLNRYGLTMGSNNNTAIWMVLSVLAGVGGYFGYGVHKNFVELHSVTQKQESQLYNLGEKLDEAIKRSTSAVEETKRALSKLEEAQRIMSEVKKKNQKLDGQVKKLSTQLDHLKPLDTQETDNGAVITANDSRANSPDIPTVDIVIRPRNP
jgi:Sec-independent protein translocase protein TatA